jgi:hypothetical protein
MFNSIVKQLGRELVPTSTQSFIIIVLSATILIVAQLSSVYRLLGISRAGVDVTQSGIKQHLGFVLNSSLAGTLTLVIFWATVGLFAYLVCWKIYTGIVAARNEVTINVAYENRGNAHGSWKALAIKAVCAAALVILLGMAVSGITLWISVAAPFFVQITMLHGFLALIALIGMAIQFYLIFLVAQLTFSPWYNGQPFTD